VRDVVSTVLRRLGMVGVILVASALLFGVLAGAVVVHRLDTTPTASNESAQSDKSGGEQTNKQTKPPKSKHPTQGQPSSPEPDDSQDKDA
jgi:uncharacterized membrane protein